MKAVWNVTCITTSEASYRLFLRQPESTNEYFSLFLHVVVNQSKSKTFIYQEITGKPVHRVENSTRPYLRACVHGGGGPQAGEVTRLGGVSRLSTQCPILIWPRLRDSWGDRQRVTSGPKIRPCAIFNPLKRFNRILFMRERQKVMTSSAFMYSGEDSTAKKTDSMPNILLRIDYEWHPYFPLGYLSD